MRNFAKRAIVLVASVTLAGCGGGGGGGIASIGATPPPVAPTPSPTPSTGTFALLLKGPATDQQLSTAGASYQGSVTQPPLLSSSDQLQVRYVASSNTYEVQLPNSQSWIGLTSRSEVEASGGGVTVSRQYANDFGGVFRWSTTTSLVGYEAAGIATPANSIPTTGSATYTAIGLGPVSEPGGVVDPIVTALLTFNFDFGKGTLSGTIAPEIDPEWHGYKLDTLSFRDTVYSIGKSTFSGKFDTSLSGLNSFEGLFTGPNAQGVIGNFAFPYKSPIDGNVRQAAGAFSGTK